MPKTKVLFYQEADGSCPFKDWVLSLSSKAQLKCFRKLERLAEMGHELRRPEADVLRDKIYELRASFQGCHYRILYFFDGNIATVVSHGLVKESAVPPIEIQRAVDRKAKFEANRARHTYLKEMPWNRK